MFDDKEEVRKIRFKMLRHFCISSAVIYLIYRGLRFMREVAMEAVWQ